jgi:hypothetical protein
VTQRAVRTNRSTVLNDFVKPRVANHVDSMQAAKGRSAAYATSNGPYSSVYMSRHRFRRPRSPMFAGRCADENSVRRTPP